MLNIHTSELGQSVYMTELYDFLGLRKSDYSRFVKKNLLKNFFADENKEYSACMQSNTKIGKRGQYRKEYYINIDFAKKLCMISNSHKGEEIRNYLVQLTKKVENAKLIDSNQVVYIIKMVKIFAVYEFRKKALEQNQNNFIKNTILLKPEYHKNTNLLYAKFHQWRNEILGLGKEELNKRLLDYCIIEKKALPRLKNKDEILTFFGEYEQIKVDFWDLLSSQNKSEEMINNICDLAGEIAKEIKPYLHRFNETNLFQKEIEYKEINKILQ